MSTTKPTVHPTWATDSGVTLEPSAGAKAAGWVAGTRPPARWMNWVQNNLAEWSNWMFDRFVDIVTANWTERSNPKSFNLNDIAYGANKFVAVGDNDGADSYIVYSQDGSSIATVTDEYGHYWTESANPKPVNLNAIAWSPTLSLFCAVGANDPAAGYTYIITSPTGLTGTWTQRVAPKTLALNSICWSEELTLFVAVGAPDADSYILTSPDGINWTERAPTVAKVVSLQDVAYSPELDLFVAVGDNDGADGYILTSPDGITWTERSNAGNGFDSVAWSSHLTQFVAAEDDSASGGAGDIYYSSNGTTWTSTTRPEDDEPINTIIWVDRLDIWAGIGDSMGGVSALFIISRDGVTWEKRLMPNGSGNMESIASSDHALVAVGVQDGADADILTSMYF